MQASPDDPVSAARDAIVRLYEAGLLDEDHATLGLLALSIGVRRMQVRRAERRDGTPGSLTLGSAARRRPAPDRSGGRPMATPSAPGRNPPVTTWCEGLGPVCADR